MPREFSMPIVHPRATDGYRVVNQAPIRVLVREPIRRIDGPQTGTADGLSIQIEGLPADAEERKVYACAKGYLAFARQTSPAGVRAWLMIDDATKRSFSEASRTVGSGRRRHTYKAVGFKCVTYFEYQNLDPGLARTALHALITDAVATPRTAAHRWVLSTGVAPVIAEEGRRRTPPQLSSWLEDHTIDDYLDQYLLADASLDNLATALAAGRRPNVFGLHVNAGDVLGSLLDTGTAGTYRLFFKVWEQYDPPGSARTALRPLNPGHMLHMLLQYAHTFRFAGDNAIDSGNNLGFPTLEPLTFNAADAYPPDDESRRRIHPVLWNMSRDGTGRSYSLTERDGSTNRVRLVRVPLRFAHEQGTRSFDDYCAVYASERFSTAAEIDAFFNRITSGAQANFIDWFRARLETTPPWLRFSPRNGCCGGAPGSLRIPVSSRARFTIVWSNIPHLFGTTHINFVQFANMVGMMIRETGGTFRPLSEGGGLDYLFQYNGRDGLRNKSCLEHFGDPLYLFAHGALVPGTTLAHATDAAWDGSTYPAGYATDVDDPSVAFIAQGDFAKFRGRGYIQTTGRGNYRKLAEHVLNYTGTQPVILAVKTRWDTLLTGAAAQPGVHITDRIDAAETVSTNADWDDLFQNSNDEFPTWAHRAFFESGSTNLLDYPPGTDPFEYVWETSDKVAGAECSCEANLLRTYAIIRTAVDG